jgi:hypothetical protein
MCLPAKAITVDGVTQVTLIDIPINKNSGMNITSKLIAASSTQSWAFDMFVKAKNIGGIVTVQPPIITKIGDTNVPTVSAVVFGNNVRLRVKGVAATTINWVSTNCLLFVP